MPVGEALLDPNSDFGQKSKGLIVAASSAEPGKRDGAITEYTVNMPAQAVTEDEDGRPILSRYGVVDGRSNMKLIVELQKLLEDLPGPLNTHAQVQDHKENLAGSGYNTHAVGRNPGLWTAEYSILEDAVMQQELDAMKAKLDAAGVATWL